MSNQDKYLIEQNTNASQQESENDNKQTPQDNQENQNKQYYKSYDDKNKKRKELEAKLLDKNNQNDESDNQSNSKYYQSEVVNSYNSNYNSLPVDRKISDYRFDANIRPKKSILKQSKSFTDVSSYMVQPRVDQFGNPINEQKKQHIVINKEVEEYQVENWKSFNQDMSQERDCCTCTLI